MEENIGKEQCVVTAHNALPLVEDMMRFSHCDNFWCFAPERVVKRYKYIQTNNKNIESTFAKTEIKREILALSRRKKKITYQLDQVHGLVSSIEGARNYCDSENPIAFIGAMSISNTNVHVADAALREALESLDLNADVYQSFRSSYLYHQRSILKIGSFVVLSGGNIGKIEEFIFIKLDDYSKKLARLEMFPFDGHTIKNIKTVRRSAQRNIVPIEKVLRKVLVYTGENDQLLCVDYDRPTFEFNFSALP
ncbi:uncharacterized protein [Clytia hemisphaerica]|uniref:uncharacterized protein n=1 Tax=Clytia hemisphaerica TaxID=252671 RepID=UPI0034D644B3